MAIFKMVRIQRALAALAIAYPVAYACSQYFVLTQDHDAIVASTESAALNMARALKEHAWHALNEADSLSRALIADVESSRLSPSWENRVAMDRILKRHSMAPSHVAVVSIISSHGKLIATTALRPTHPIDFGDRSFRAGP